MGATDKKIHVMHVVGDPVGGLRLHIHTLLRGLDPTFYRLSYAYSEQAVDKKFEQDLPELKAFLEVELPLQVPKKPHFLDIINLVKLYRIVKQHKVDIIHGHGAKGGAYARVIASASCAKAVYTPHGGVVHDMFSRFESMVYKMIERILKGCTAYYIFESVYTKKSFMSKFGEIHKNWKVIYNGIDLPDEKAIELLPSVVLQDHGNREVKRFGTFAMLREQKGQYCSIQAIKKLNGRGYKISLHLFGDGPDRKKLECLVRQLNLEKSVFFYGDVDQVAPYMCAMDAVLIPSLFESFGYVALEALALGCPILASSVGGLTEILTVTHGGLFKAGDVASMSVVMEKFLSGLDDRSEFILDQTQARHFSASLMVEGIQAIYQSLMV